MGGLQCAEALERAVVYGDDKGGVRGSGVATQQVDAGPPNQTLIALTSRILTGISAHKEARIG